MKFVFFGTPDFTLPVINALHKAYKTPDGLPPIEAVVTQPPRPVGRKKQLSYSAIDTWAHKKNDHIKYDSAKINILHNPLDLTKLPKLESKVAILAAYGAIIPKQVIDLFPMGILNIHPSLLPELRGASPIQAALAMGKDETGISIMKMDEKLDHGPIVTQSVQQILPEDTNRSLTERVFEVASEILIEMLPAYEKGRIKLKPQDHDKATFTSIIRREHGYVPFEALKLAMDGQELIDKLGTKVAWDIPFIKNYASFYSPQTIYNFMRALHPWPGIWTFVEKDRQKLRMKILEAQLLDGKLVLQKVQLEGKNAVEWKNLGKDY